MEILGNYNLKEGSLRGKGLAENTCRERDGEIEDYATERVGAMMAMERNRDQGLMAKDPDHRRKQPLENNT